MSKKITVDDHFFDMTHVPMYFAEQPATLLLGPFVSRLTFGVTEEDSGDFPRPVVTIAIPTIALMRLVHDLKKSFDSVEFKKDSAAALGNAAKTIASGGKPTPSNEVIVNDVRKPKIQKAIAAK